MPGNEKGNSGGRKPAATRGRAFVSGAGLSWLARRPILLSHPPQPLAKLLQGDDDFVHGP